MAEWSGAGAVNETEGNRWGKMRIFRRFALEIAVGDLRGRFLVGLGRAETRSFRRRSDLKDGDRHRSCRRAVLAGLPFAKLATGKECVQLCKVSAYLKPQNGAKVTDIVFAKFYHHHGTFF